MFLEEQNKTSWAERVPWYERGVTSDAIKGVSDWFTNTVRLDDTGTAAVLLQGAAEAAYAATSRGATKAPSATETSAALVAASTTSGARNRILARFKPASPPDDAPPTSEEDDAASVKPGIADALDVSTIGRFVFATRVASAATNPRSSPRKTSTSSKRMSVLSS